MNTTAKRPDEMTLTELKARAGELGIETSAVEPLEADGDAPVKADWLREVLKAEGARNDFKPEWREAGTELVALFGEVDGSEVSATGRGLAASLASGSSTNADLVSLRDAVKTTAAALREADRRDLATQFSHANYHVRRAERATRPTAKS